MPLYTYNTTANETPDSGQGGLAVTGVTNTGHGSTTASQSGAGAQSKTARWFTVPAGIGAAVSVILKVDWTENGTIVNGGTNAFTIQYSLNNGGAWSTLLNHSNVTSSSSATESVTLSNTQDLTQVQVRDFMNATGGGVGDSASVTTTISLVRVEVTTSAGTILMT